MEEKVRVNVHGYSLICHLKYAMRTSRRFSYNGGQIYITVSPRFSLKQIESLLNRTLKKELVETFNTHDYLDESRIDIFGNTARLINVKDKDQYLDLNRSDFIYSKIETIQPRLNKLLLEYLTKRVEELERLMEIPQPHKVKVTSMSACNGKNYFTKYLLTFNKILVHYSKEIIDAIVIHELAHYYFHNHSKDFYKVVYKYCPDYKILVKKLARGERK